MFIIEDIVSTELHEQVLQAAATVEFVDGTHTAGRWDGQGKRNTQALREPIEPLCRAVMAQVMKNRRFSGRALPHEAVQPMLNRYRVGDQYGLHEDSPIQSGIRADLSYTLFLSDPSTYEGGELVLGEGQAAVPIKLPARSLVCYPSGTLHQVLPVTAGERLAMVGWVQSLVRDAAARRLLSELREATDALTERGGMSGEVGTLSRVYGGLLRRWAFG
ncbi:MAG: Fe2+-dependent dioxygenase [Nannocystaceae bacterium]